VCYQDPPMVPQECCPSSSEMRAHPPPKSLPATTEHAACIEPDLLDKEIEGHSFLPAGSDEHPTPTMCLRTLANMYNGVDITISLASSKLRISGDRVHGFLGIVSNDFRRS
ncbi:hypothetical protein, partial [Mesorhizobium sp. M5C.F.Ca.IN.020.32.2.1]|uniref:hypothetical protein n=1 Tax=Mesorhizobium sp. M5C.F.Ca.IN.020.32.2.1 TaxID=2496771 RepID=UPI0019D49459